MGEAKRRKQLYPNWGKQNQTKRIGSKNDFPMNEAKNLVEYVKQNTALKGRGYLACTQDKCFYYGQEDFLGDEDDLLKKYVNTYHPDREVVLVKQVTKGGALFTNEIVPLESFLD